MDEYYRILESLPPALRTPLAKLDAHYAPHIQEIRLRLGQPVQFTICGRLCPAAKFLPGSGLPAALETDTLRDCFLQLCRRSVYAYEDELKQGYFTYFDRVFGYRKAFFGLQQTVLGFSQFYAGQIAEFVSF